MVPLETRFSYWFQPYLKIKNPTNFGRVFIQIEVFIYLMKNWTAFWA